MLRSLITALIWLLFSASTVLAEAVLVYAHDQNGNAVSGSFSDLVNAALGGETVRVRYERTDVTWVRTCNSISATEFDLVISPAAPTAQMALPPQAGLGRPLDWALLRNIIVTCFMDNSFDTEKAEFGRKFALPPAFERIIINSSGVRQVLKVSTVGDIVSNPDIMQDRLPVSWLVVK
jgi:hypothetical protein